MCKRRLRCSRYFPISSRRRSGYFEIPDLDLRAGSGTKPVSVWRESEGVDSITTFKSVKMFVCVKIPQHGLGVLSSGGSQGAVRGDSYCVKMSVVANVVGLQLAVLEVPYLDHVVPSC